MSDPLSDTVFDAMQSWYGPGNPLSGGLIQEISDSVADAVREAGDYFPRDQHIELGEPGYNSQVMYLLRDKPHRCPSCYVSGRKLLRTKRWALHWCHRCGYLWGGRWS